MSAPPQALLSEAFSTYLKDMRLEAAVFLTYSLNPGFFEEEVLPVFLSIPTCDSVIVRYRQLLDHMGHGGPLVSVYFDPNALTAETRSVRLNVRYVPCPQDAGRFHPKNVFVLLAPKAQGEDAEAVDQGRVLLVGTMSANLTRDGWWSNVEACDIERVEERSSLKEDIRRFLNSIRREAPADSRTDALEMILGFLRSQEVQPFVNRSTGGVLRPWFYGGQAPLADFLHEKIGDKLGNTRVEIISPFFDKKADLKTLKALTEAFSLEEARILLPRNENGAAECSQDLYEAVSRDPKLCWARFRKDEPLLDAGPRSKGPRYVHAKVYRFISGRSEYVFVGSPNLTWAAHSGRNNVESGILRQVARGDRDWWLVPDRDAVTQWAPPPSGQDGLPNVPLCLQFDWVEKKGFARWYGAASKALISLFEGAQIQGQIPTPRGDGWAPLPEEISVALERILPRTPFLYAESEGFERTAILVEELGALRRPWEGQQLTLEDILRSWTFLAPHQRARFWEKFFGSRQRYPGEAQVPEAQREKSFFDDFAAIFQGFDGLGRGVAEAFSHGRADMAAALLLSGRSDSLDALIGAWDKVQGKVDPVSEYLVLLSARRIVDWLGEKVIPEFPRQEKREVEELANRINSALDAARRSLPDGLGEVDEFARWYERSFMRSP